MRFQVPTARVAFIAAVVIATACPGVLLTGCLSNPAPAGQGGEGPAAESPPTVPSGWPAIPWPSDNPYNAAKAELGRRLFFDPTLSSTGVISCSWCHSERASFADNHSDPFSTGVRLQATQRNTPTLVNVAFGRVFLLDGAAATLEEQALRPLLSHREMDMTGPQIIATVTGDPAYARLFREAFGDAPITLDAVAKALATYERTLLSFHSPYDQWKAGDSSALWPEAKRGEALFMGKAGCARCHVPPLFTDGGFHNTGLDALTSDSGRALVTGLTADIGKFKTPTLRNLPWTRPYMHDGRFMDLDDVMNHYNTGGAAHPARDSLIRPLALSYGEIMDIKAFLESLTDQKFLDRYNP
jgi:cytochrome c peroxidase